MDRIYIAGLGAIGAAYGAIMAQHACEGLRILVNEERRSRYQSGPQWINDTPYDFQYLVPQEQPDQASTGLEGDLAHDLEAQQPADLILIACKYTQLEEVCRLIGPVVGEHTLILPLLNGIDSEQIVATYYGAERTVNALCFGIDSVRENGRVRYGNPGRIVFGEMNNEQYSPRIERVKTLLERYGVPIEIPVDYERVQWRKFMINVANNQTSAVLLAPYGVYQEIPEAKELMIQAMWEVVRIANAKGIALGQEDIDLYLKLLPSFDPEGKSSTHQDMEAGRKTEVEMFASVVSRLGNELGIKTPINDMLYLMIRTMEKMRGVS